MTMSTPIGFYCPCCKAQRDNPEATPKDARGEWRALVNHFAPSFCDTCLRAYGPATLPARPAPEIERLIDTLVDKAWWCAHASSFDIDAATADCKAARSDLVAAIRSQVPADLAGLLREHLAACEANDDPLGRRFESLDPKLAAWTRANLPAKETTDG